MMEMMATVEAMETMATMAALRRWRVSLHLAAPFATWGRQALGAGAATLRGRATAREAVRAAARAAARMMPERRGGPMCLEVSYAG